MQLNRRKTLGALGIATFAAALPASAARAVTTPLIYYIGATPTPGVGVWAEVHCEVGVASVTARMFNHDGTVEIGRHTLTLHPDTNPVRGRWVGPPLAGIPLGFSLVEIEATSTDGGVATRTGDFVLLWDAVHLMTLSPSPIDHLHRTVTITGTLLGTHPLTQEQAPLPGLRIDVAAAYTRPGRPSPPPPLLVTTAADGSYTAQLTLAGAAEITAGPHDHPRDTLVSGGWGTRQLSVDARQVRITAGIGAPQLKLGESTTLEGRLEVLVEGEWLPLAGHPVEVEFVPASGGERVLEQVVDTDGEGRFRATVLPPSTGRYDVVFNRDEVDEFFRSAAASVSVAILQPVRFSTELFIVRPTPDVRDDPADHEMTGVIYTALNPAVIEIQYRPRPSGTWQTLAATRDSHGSNDGGKVFTARFTVPGSGQVRAFAPQTSLTQSAASETVSIRLPERLVPQRPPGDGGGTTPTSPTLPPQRRY